MRFSIPFHKFLEEYQGCLAIAALGNKGLQDFSFVVNRPPQIVCFAIDLYENFIEMPFPV